MKSWKGKGIMSKKTWLPLLGITILLCTACGQKEIPAVNQEPTEENRESVQQMTEESAEPVQVRIYFSRIGESGLESAEETISGLRPENLLSHLGLHNIVSIDTKVNSFSEEEAKGKKILYLDLTKQYGEYVNTMNEQSENSSCSVDPDFSGGLWCGGTDADRRWKSVDHSTPYL